MVAIRDDIDFFPILNHRVVGDGVTFPWGNSDAFIGWSGPTSRPPKFGRYHGEVWVEVEIDWKLWYHKYWWQHSRNIYMPLNMDLFGRLFFEGLPEKVLFWNLTGVAIQALGKQLFFPLNPWGEAFSSNKQTVIYSMVFLDDQMNKVWL